MLFPKWGNTDLAVVIQRQICCGVIVSSVAVSCGTRQRLSNVTWVRVSPNLQYPICRARLVNRGGLDDPLQAKPKGMQGKTYNRLVAEFDRPHDAWAFGVMGWLKSSGYRPPITVTHLPLSACDRLTFGTP